MNRHDAYLALLERHRPLVWRMCWLRARGDWERCRDLVQEVSIALWLHFDKLRPDATPGEERAWVRWLTRSTLDHLHRSPSPTLLPLSAELAATLKADTSHDEDIEELLSSLTPDDQRLMRLHLEGYHADEIAEHMGLKRDAVYQRMHRAVGKMRRLALLLALLGVTAIVAVAVVPQWRKQVFHLAPEEVVPEEEALAPREAIPAPPVIPLEIPLDTVEPKPAWTPPEPLPYLTSPVDTTLPDLPARKPEVAVAFDDGKLTLTGLTDGELVVVRNTKGVLVALKRCHGTRCTIQFPDGFAASSGSTYILQIGNRPNRIRIEL